MRNFIALAAVAAVTMTVAFAPKPAEARDGAIAAGVVGGLAVGAIVGSQMNDGPRYRNRAYARECYIERRDYEDRYGRLHVRNVRVCN